MQHAPADARALRAACLAGAVAAVRDALDAESGKEP